MANAIHTMFENELLALFALLIAHAVADYPLQGDFIGTFKSRHSKNPFAGEGHPWFVLLSAHCLIHAGFVWLILGWKFALAELVLHFIIDLAKNEKKTNFLTDQLLHVTCKLGYCVVLLASSFL